MKTTGEAIRGFQTACQDNKSQFNLYPHDFTLVELGDYLETNAKITVFSSPRILSNASEFVRNASQSQISQTLKPLIQELDKEYSI